MHKVVKAGMSSADDEVLRLQVMPSLATAARAGPVTASGGASTALVAVGQAGKGAMAPPPLPGKAKAVPRRQVLEEEEYYEKLGKIIERDFFPDLPKLELQLKVRPLSHSLRVRICSG